MDYGKFTLEELKKGYRFDKDKEAYVCIYCEQTFPAGQIFQWMVIFIWRSTQWLNILQKSMMAAFPGS